MKAGDKFYQIVSPMKPMILSGKANERETEGSIIIDGKMRKIGEWYPEEHTVEEIYPEENIVMDEDFCEYGINDVYWDYEKALSRAAELNAAEKYERRRKMTKKKLERLANENYEKSRRLGEGSKAQVMYTSYAYGIRRALYEIEKEAEDDAE